MANKFCRQLSNGFKINVQEDKLMWSPCCFYSKRVNMYDTETLKKEMDYARSITDWVPECKMCQDLEEKNVAYLNPRQQCTKWIPEESADGDCVHLEMSFDTKCNAACMSCGSYCSTTWAKFDKKHGRDKHPVPKQIKLSSNIQRKITGFEYGVTLDSSATDMSDIHFAKLISLVPLDKMVTLFLLGGEPFYTKSHIKMLRHLKETHPDLSKVSLRYQTNGSIYPSDEVLKLWEDYHFINFGVSFDDIGDRFNYLRWPLNWKKCSNNLVRLMNETDCELHVNSTYSPLNIYYYDELDAWLKANIPNDSTGRVRNKMIRPNPCQGDMDLKYTSPKLIEKIYKKYGENHDVVKVLSNIELDSNWGSMFSYIEEIDKLRRQDWRKTFPEVASCY